MTRRHVLALLPAAAALFGTASEADAQHGFFSRRRKQKPIPDQKFMVYLGSVTGKPGEGIYLAQFDAKTGQLTQPALAAATHNPSYLAAARIGGKHLLYAANEGADEETSAASTFLLDPKSGALKPLGKAPCGVGPCYIAVDATGTAAFTANYMGSSVTSFRVQPDGTLSNPVEQLDFRQPRFGHHGPNTGRQDAPHPHCATLSPDNRFLVVCDLGNDDIVTMYVKPGTAQLGAPQLNRVHTPGSGPRHLVFHQNGRWVYVIDELSSRIDHYLWNATHASASTGPEALLTYAGNSVSTVDDGYHGSNTAAEIAFSLDGQFLYASNRGENSLVVFRVDPASGAPSVVQRLSCGGRVPRQFMLSPDGGWLVCGNQESGTVTVFKRDAGSGQLSGPVQTIALEMPEMILFA